MGEVWRARDGSLDRDVAIKVLPPELARDPERLARFEREAKVLAAINHANIAMADTGWLKTVTKQFANLLKTEPTTKGEES